jgi:hypothetical protein
MVCTSSVAHATVWERQQLCAAATRSWWCQRCVGWPSDERGTAGIRQAAAGRQRPCSTRDRWGVVLIGWFLFVETDVLSCKWDAMRSPLGLRCLGDDERCPGRSFIFVITRPFVNSCYQPVTVDASVWLSRLKDSLVLLCLNKSFFWLCLLIHSLFWRKLLLWWRSQNLSSVGPHITLKNIYTS